MANGIRINNLNQATSLNDTDTITIIQDNENKKASISLFDKDGTYTQSVVNTIPDLITTSKANVETTKQAIDEKFGDDKFSTQIITSQEMSSVGVSDDGSVDVSSQVRDGFMESAILSGNTLVNLNSSGKSKSSSTNVCDFTMTYLKPNTTYTVTFEMSYEGAESNGTLGFLTADKSNWNVNKSYSGNGSYKELLTTTSSIDLGVTLRFRRNVVDGNFTVSNVIVLEGDYTNVDIPYFEGMQSVKMPVLKVTGKNLYSGKNDFIKVNKGKEHNFYSNVTENATRLRFELFDKDKNLINDENSFVMRRVGLYGDVVLKGTTGAWAFGSDKKQVALKGTINAEYIKIREDSSEYDNLMIYESTEQIAPTTYEPFKSNILTVNEDVTLRGIGDVKDELNLLTGELTQRIKEVVLDGSENWLRSADFSSLTNTVHFQIQSDTVGIEFDSPLISDKFINREVWISDMEGINCASNGNLAISINRNKLSGLEVADFKQWLSQNNVTVVGKSTESIKTVDLNSSNGDAKTPIVYKNGHILLQSDGLIPELHYSIPVSYNGLIAQNTMTNLKHSWRLDELEIMAYTSIVNSQYESLILVATAETNEVVVSSDYVQDESLYNMLKVLVNASALENADEKINVFYLYGKLSDEMYIDLIMGDDM